MLKCMPHICITAVAMVTAVIVHSDYKVLGKYSKNFSPYITAHPGNYIKTAMHLRSIRSEIALHTQRNSHTHPHTCTPPLPPSHMHTSHSHPHIYTPHSHPHICTHPTHTLTHAHTPHSHTFHVPAVLCEQLQEEVGGKNDSSGWGHGPGEEEIGGDNYHTQ